MNYFAQGLSSGFGRGFDAVQKRREQKLQDQNRQADREEREKFAKMDLSLRQQKLAEDIKNSRADQALRQAKYEDEHMDRALGRVKSQLDSQWRAQPGLSPAELSRRDYEAERLRGMRLQNEALAAKANAPAQAPTARVRQPFGPGGKGFAEYDLPVADLGQLTASPAQPYKSPYAGDIARLGKTIADEQAEIAGGDTRSGFMNMTSRADTVSKAQAQRANLLLMELEDKVRSGVLSQEDADAEADRLLGAGL